MKTSPRRSFEGYDFKEALVRNKDSVKALVAIITGANFLVGFDWKIFGLSLAGATIALATKLIGDAVDFWFGEVEL